MTPVAGADGTLSAINERFREVARQDERLLRRSSFSELDQPNPMLLYAVQPWPTFVGRRVMGQVEEIAVRLSGLIRELPERVFGNDAERLGRYFDLAPEFVAATLAPPSGIAGSISRADFMLTAQGFRCIEFNIASSLGGWESQVVTDILLRVPAVGELLDRHAVRYVHRSPVHQLFMHAIREILASSHWDGDAINFGIGLREMLPPLAARMFGGYLSTEYRTALHDIDPALTGELLLCPYEELDEQKGSLYLHGTRLDGLLEWHGHGTHAIAFRCLKAGTIELYNGPSSFILADKRCLALLSRYADDTDLFAPEDAALIRQHVPWTRRVLPGEASYRGETVEIPDLIISRQQDLVLKKGHAVSAAGRDVFLGKTTSGEQWADVLRRALEEGDWVTQEVVESLPFFYQNGEEGCCAHDVIWGPFVFGQTFAGVSLRMQPKALSGVVNLHRGATVGVVFEVEED